MRNTRIKCGFFFTFDDLSGSNFKLIRQSNFRRVRGRCCTGKSLVEKIRWPRLLTHRNEFIGFYNLMLYEFSNVTQHFMTKLANDGHNLPKAAYDRCCCHIELAACFGSPLYTSPSRSFSARTRLGPRAVKKSAATTNRRPRPGLHNKT